MWCVTLTIPSLIRSSYRCLMMNSDTETPLGHQFYWA